MSEDNHLKKFIHDLVALMRRDEELDYEATLLTIEDFRAQLEEFYNKYEGSCPEGAEELRQLMQDAITLLYGALENLEAFIEEPDERLLDLALQEAEESDELMQRAAKMAMSASESEPLFG